MLVIDGSSIFISVEDSLAPEIIRLIRAIYSRQPIPIVEAALSAHHASRRPETDAVRSGLFDELGRAAALAGRSRMCDRECRVDVSDSGVLIDYQDHLAPQIIRVIAEVYVRNGLPVIESAIACYHAGRKLTLEAIPPQLLDKLDDAAERAELRALSKAQE